MKRRKRRTRNAKVLNASRHQRKWNALSSVRTSAALSVLNASRHQRKWNGPQGPPGTAQLSGVCSTPLGIKGSGTRLGQDIDSRLPGCSTPLGIKGSGTSCPEYRIKPLARAQRLSASKEVEPDVAISKVDLTRCSTPLGIKGSGTFRPIENGRGACRCSTPLGIKGSGTRLTPGRRSAGRGCSTPLGIKGSGTCCPLKGVAIVDGAQRLSASKEVELRSLNAPQTGDATASLQAPWQPTGKHPLQARSRLHWANRAIAKKRAKWQSWRYSVRCKHPC